MKTCPGCAETKDFSLFSKNRSTKDGLQMKCKACVKIDFTKLYAQPGYVSWISMKQRVSEKSDKREFYFDRGISMHEPWKKFDTFINDMGQPPTPQHTIERIDNDGNYEPGNVRWATMKEQCRNRRSNKFITYDGETLCYEEWSERLGGSRGLVWGRLKRGWSEEDAVTVPSGHSRT